MYVVWQGAFVRLYGYIIRAYNPTERRISGVPFNKQSKIKHVSNCIVVAVVTFI